MAAPSGNRLMTALDGIIKDEVASALKNLTVDEMIDAILRRPDHQTIYDKLLDRIYEGSIPRMVNAREDARKIYQDLFDTLIAKMSDQSRDRQDQGVNTEAPDKKTPSYTHSSTQASMVSFQAPSHESACGSRPQVLRAKHPSLPPRSNSPKTNPLLPQGALGANGVSKDAVNTVEFEPLGSDLGAWAPMFMSEDKLHTICGRIKKWENEPAVTNLIDFIQFLNPSYLCYRAEVLITKCSKKRLKSKLLTHLDDEAGIYECWNAANEEEFNEDGLPINDMLQAFVAVECYNLHKKQRAKHNRDENLDAFATYAQLEKDQLEKIGMSNRNAAYLEVDKAKWRDIMKLGRKLSSLLDDFGGKTFLVLFPFGEFTQSFSMDLIATYDDYNHAWELIRDLLEKTDLGELFRSLSNAVGNILLSRIKGRVIPMHRFMERIVPIFEKYSIKGVTGTSPRTEISTVLDQPGLSPFVFCGNHSRQVRLSAGMSFSPRSLLQMTHGTLEEDFVYYLIQQELPNGWSLLNMHEISQAADEDLLLRDFEGIVIPLFIDDCWCLFCYMNPTRSTVTHPISFINPTESKEAFIEARALLTHWIPQHQDWVPKSITVDSINVIDSQTADRLESGVHVILHARAMSRTGKPEQRQVDREMCFNFRVRHFVALLNEIQQATSKAALKGKAREPAAGTKQKV